MAKNRDYELGLYEKAIPNNISWEDKLIAAKEAGYDFIEMSIDETDEKLSRLNWTKEERAELIKLMCKHSVYIRSMCLSGHRKYPLGSEKYQTISLEIMEKAIILAYDLGIRVVMLAGYDVYYEESTANTKMIFEANLKKSCLIAAKYGVLLGFETMETEFMNTVEKAMKYVEKIDSPYLMVYPDIGNITNAAVAYNTSVIGDIDTALGKICAVHLKETVPSVFRECEYGTGHVDFKNTIRHLKNLGVRRYVAEFWHVGEENWKEKLRDNLNFLSKYLDE